MAEQPVPLPRPDTDRFWTHFTTGLAYIDGRLVLSMGEDCYGEEYDKPRVYVTSVHELFGGMQHVLGHA